MFLSFFSEQKQMTITNEKELQESVVKYLRQTDILYSASLGGTLDTEYRRVDAWKAGYKSGTPDLLIYTPNEDYTGLAIEFKTPNGSGQLKKNQHDFLSRLSTSGWFCLVSNDFPVIIETIVKYTHNLL